MKLVELNKKEFQKFAEKSPEITFYQTKEWASLKKKNGWYPYFVGLEHRGKIQAAAIILSKTLPIIKKRIFYSPRGFIINYKDLELLRAFTKEIKAFAKKKNAIFIKIDPYVEYISHNNDGEIIIGKVDNKQCVDNLIKLGYTHFGFNLGQDTLQPRWMHVIETENKTIEEINKKMESKTRQILRKNEKCGITTREIERDELPKFKEIMQKTSDRREFIDRPLSYYENMWDNLHDEGILKILVAEIDFDIYEENTRKEIDEISKNLDERIYKKENNILKMNEKKYNQSNEQDKKDILRLENQFKEIQKYKYKYGHKALLGGILFLIYQNEVLSLLGGSIEELMNFQSAYTVHYAGIKYAIENGYKRYNFYGITGDFRKENPLYGLYLFKKSFGGHVVELIGEFDLVINPTWFKIYNTSYNLYHKLKNLRKSAQKKHR